MLKLTTKLSKLFGWLKHCSHLEFTFNHPVVANSNSNFLAVVKRLQIRQHMNGQFDIDKL